MSEFRPGGDANNLTLTEITGSDNSGAFHGEPAAGADGHRRGRAEPPTTVIDDDAAGNVETGRTFDPADDGIDFYERLEGMRVQVNDARRGRAAARASARSGSSATTAPMPGREDNARRNRRPRGDRTRSGSSSTTG